MEKAEGNQGIRKEMDHGNNIEDEGRPAKPNASVRGHEAYGGRKKQDGAAGEYCANPSQLLTFGVKGWWLEAIV